MPMYFRANSFIFCMNVQIHHIQTGTDDTRLSAILTSQMKECVHIVNMNNALHLFYTDFLLYEMFKHILTNHLTSQVNLKAL